MRIPPGARVYLTTAISLAAVALATWFGMQAGSARSGRGWWALGAVLASVTAAGVPAYDRAPLAEATIPMVLDSAAHLAGTGRVRACLFRFAPGVPMMLVPAQYS